MFASWNKARGAALVAAAAATFVALVPPAHALEGVQGRHAIFYPSLELVYQHDDNFYLLPDEERSADTFIAHAHFAVEVPGARQFVRFEYHPQWRSVDVNERTGDPRYNGDKVTHFWDLDAKLKGSSIFGVDIRQRFMMGALEGYRLDPNVGELIRDNGEGFWSHDLGLDFKWEGSKQGVKIMLGKEDSAFDDLDKAPDWFEINAWDLGARYNYKFAPLTSFVAGYRYTANDQQYAQRWVGTDRLGVNSTENEVWLGVDGEMGRTTTGSASAGFHTLNYDSSVSENADYEGFTVRADVTKSFSRWTKLICNVERAPNFSGYVASVSPTPGIDDENFYYVSNRISFTLDNQPQGARVGWSLIGQFQRNGWDVAESSTGKEREDDVLRLRAEVGFHPLEHLSFRLNVEHKDSDSNHDDFDFVDNLVILQLQFGF